MPCFMCSPDPESIVAENDPAIAARDAFPVSPGHTLVMTRSHTPTWFDAAKEERSAVLELVDEVKTALDGPE